MNFLSNQVPFEIFWRRSVQQTDTTAEIKDSRSFQVSVSGNEHSAGEQSTCRIYNKPGPVQQLSQVRTSHLYGLWYVEEYLKL